MSAVKVGSLFDGIGGTPLSAVMCGAEPVWASEIEKVPIRITERHFPRMKHLGDITQISGAEIDPVDIIVGGSPCQDLSVAGKRAGLDGERSGLFMDQIRIVKEMRDATRKGADGIPRPRYMVWENVPGAFSSNKGEDFRAVLEETAKIADEAAVIPRPDKGKWTNAGAILGDGYSVAWRVVDAQYWGVPQRRRRIYLVADFGGQSAPEILFEQESVSRNITEGGETGQRVAGDAKGGAEDAIAIDAYNHAVTGNIAATLTAQIKDVASTARTLDQNGGNPACNQDGVAVAQPEPYLVEMTSTKNTVVSDGICPTLTARMGTGGNQVNVVCLPQSEAAVCRMIAFGGYATDGTVSTMKQRDYKDATDLVVEPVYSLDRACFHQGINAKYGISIEENTVQTLVASGPHAVESPEQKYIVRRLTPLECERLQGYPDGWTALDHEDKVVSDSQRYKALGNSFAVPNALFFISRIVQRLKEIPTHETDY